MKGFPILYWPYKTNGNEDYQLSRKVINNLTGLMPEIIVDDLDVAGLLQEKPDAIIYMYDLGLADEPDAQVRKAGVQVTNGTMTVDEAVEAFGTFK